MFDEARQTQALRPKRRRPTKAEKKRRRLIVFGAAGAAVIVITIVAVVGYIVGDSLVNHASTQANAQANVCEGIEAAANSHAADDTQNPDEAQALSIDQTWRSQMSVLEAQAPAGPLKTTLQRYLAGLDAAIAYYQTHPNLNMADQPAQLRNLESTFNTDGQQARAICSD